MLNWVWWVLLPDMFILYAVDISIHHLCRLSYHALHRNSAPSRLFLVFYWHNPVPPKCKNICIYTEFIHTEFIHSQNNSFLYVCTSTLYTHKYIHQLNHPLLLPAAPPSCLLPWPAFTFLIQVCLLPRLMNPVQRFSN